MPLVLTLLLLAPLALAAAHALRRRVEESAAAMLLGLFLLFYLLGVFGLLGLGRWLLYLLWLAAVGYLLWVLLLKKGLRLFCKAALGPGAVLLVVCAAALWWLCRGRFYANWDEYSHWGRALKAVFGQNLLHAVAAGKDAFREYPPGVSPLQAVVMQALGFGFREDVAIFLQGLFTCGLLLYPLRRFAWRGAPAAAATGLLLFLTPSMVFWNFFTETTVDGLLGVLFGFVLLVHFLGGDAPFERTLQCLACAALPLVKASGLLLALLACGVVWFSRWRGSRAGAGHGAARADVTLESPQILLPPPLQKIKRQAALFAPVVAALLAAGSWQLFVLWHGTPRRWNAASFSFDALWQLVARGRPGWRVQVLQDYFANLFGDLNYGWPGGFLPYMAWFAVFALAFWLLCRLLPAARRAGAAAGCAALLIGGLLYVLLVLASYLFVFSQYEAVRLASLSRYLNTWLCGAAVLLAGMLAAALPPSRPARRALALAAATALWLVLGNPPQVLGSFVNAPQNAAQTANISRKYRQAAAAIAAADSTPNPRVYVVAIDDLGATLLRLDYELAPQYLPDHFSSIGPEYAGDDLLSLRIDREGWARMLRAGYDYVYLYEVKEAFVREFGPLFDDPAAITDGTLLAVQPQGENSVRLVAAS